MFLRPNHLSRSLLELLHRAEGDVRVAHLLRRPLVDRHGIRMLRPGVELELLVRLRDQLRERARRGRVGRALLRLVLAVRRGLPDRDQCLRAPRLDPGVAGRRELRVGGRADDLALLVELRGEEVAEVRLVPDPVEAHERVAGAAGRCSGSRPRARSSGSPPSSSAGTPAPCRRSPTSACPRSSSGLPSRAAGCCGRTRPGRRSGRRGRTSSSRCAGRFGATLRHSTSVRTIVAFAARTLSSSACRLSP